MTRPPHLSRGAGPAAAQFAQFVLVGVSNTAVSFAVYSALLWADVPYWLAGAIAFLVGAANGYFFNRRWTFAARDSVETRVKYLVVQLAGLAATSALLWLLVTSGALGRLAAYAVTVPIVTVSTFLANRGWVFDALDVNARAPARATRSRFFSRRAS